MIRKISNQNFDEILLNEKLEIYNNFNLDKTHNEKFIVGISSKNNFLCQKYLILNFLNQNFLEINNINNIDCSFIQKINADNLYPFIHYQNNKVYVCQGFYLYQHYDYKNYIIILQKTSVQNKDKNSINIYSVNSDSYLKQQKEVYNLINLLFPRFIASFTPFTGSIRIESGLSKRIEFLKKNI